MNNLMAKEVTMTSVGLAEVTGKQHQHIMRDIRAEITNLGEEIGQSIFGQTSYNDSQGRPQPCYTFGKKGAMQLALKYDAKTRYKVIAKLEELEQGQALPKLSKEIQAIFVLDQKQQKFETRLDTLENNATIDFGQQRNLQVLAQKTVLRIIGGKETPVYKDKPIRSKVFSSLWKDYKDYMQVASYRDTLKIDYNRAVTYITNWRLNGKLLREVEECNSQMELVI